MILPSWNDGDTKRAIVDFVTKTTTEGIPDFVRVPDRIALFDNDGTLWVEQPLYTQLAFLLESVREAAPQHPEWKTTEPFHAALRCDAMWNDDRRVHQNSDGLDRNGSPS